LVLRMKKFIALFLIACLCGGILSACTTLQSDDDKGAIISMFITSFPQSFDPSAVLIEADTAKILSLIYQPLTVINEKGEVKGALAKSWYSYYDDREENGVYKMYFVLNKTMWSDGIQVSALDVVYAWKRILTPENQSPYASLLYPIKNAKKVKSGVMTSDDLGIVAESDTLLCVSFENDYNINLFAEAVSCIALSPLREQVIERAIKENPKDDPQKYDRKQDWDKNAAIMVCNGPYKVQGYEEGTKLVLERNVYYYRNPEKDYLDEKVVPYRLNCIYQPTTIIEKSSTTIDEFTYQFNKYKDGKSYFLGAFNPETYAALKDKIKTDKLLSTYTYFFNTTHEVLSDAKVRQALSAALDRDKITEIMGVGMIASKGFVPSGVFDEKSGSDFRKAGNDIYSTKADTEKAKSLLKEAGVSGGELKLYYIIPWASTLFDSTTAKYKDVKNQVAKYNPYEEIAKYAKTVWDALGFEVTLTPVFADKYRDELSAGNWDIIGVDYSINSVDAFAYLAPFATYYSGNAVSVSLEAETFTPHYTGLEDEDYDALMDSIVDVSDRKERASLLHSAEEAFASLCPATSLFQYTTSYVISSKLDNLTKDSWYGYFDFSDLRLDNYIAINSAEAEESLAIAATQSTDLEE